MRPVLNPALRRFWRDFHTLQFGLHPRHAVLLGRLTPASLLRRAGGGGAPPGRAGRAGPPGPALGAFVPAARGRARAPAAHYAQKRAAPEGRRPRHGQRADLLVHASSRPLLTEAARQLRLSGVPHLAVTVRETVAVVGPLGLPGRTACLACADRHRIYHDP